MSENVNDVRLVLRKWDKGSKKVRETMLVEFIEQCENMTAPELEQQFQDCASLFLARLTAWLRLSYMTNPCLQVLLRAVSVFIVSTSGQHYLTEFLEVGGMLTLLEIISLQTAKEEDKAEALCLLTSIANKGRQFKELLCESFGAKLVAECLALSSSEDTQECARNLLHQLCSGNPRYQSLVYKVLIALLSSTSDDAQRMAAYTLRQVQEIMGVVSAAIVEPVLQLLRNLRIDIQQETLELLGELVMYEEVQQPIMVGLVHMLKPELHSLPKPLQDDSTITSAPLPVYVQQAGVAKAIRLLSSKSTDVVERFVELGVMPYLMFAMANTAYPNAQREASLTMAEFVKKNIVAQNQLLSHTGKDFYYAFTKNPENFYDDLTPSQVDVLVASLEHGHH